MIEYFSDREQDPKPRTEEVISPKAWCGIVSIIESRITTGAFGAVYPEMCDDGTCPIGTDINMMNLAIQGEMPDLSWPVEITLLCQQNNRFIKQPLAPDIFSVLDLIEFCHRIVAEPIKGHFHGHFNHHHLTFNDVEGKRRFRDEINRVFSRNNLAYELNPDGLVVRLGPAILRESLSSACFNTGESTLDGMLEESRAKFLNPSPSIRKEALERLWDCWERLKSLEIPEKNKKKESIKALIDQASSDPEFITMLDTEANTLTKIGNTFGIRHSEKYQRAITESAHIDYLFHRLYSLITLLLSKRRDVGD